MLLYVSCLFVAGSILGVVARVPVLIAAVCLLLAVVSLGGPAGLDLPVARFAAATAAAAALQVGYAVSVAVSALLRRRRSPALSDGQPARDRSAQTASRSGP
jgi:hypothetical protein